MMKINISKKLKLHKTARIFSDSDKLRKTEKYVIYYWIKSSEP